jgi:hypothetical protein
VTKVRSLNNFKRPQFEEMKRNKMNKTTMRFDNKKRYK